MKPGAYGTEAPAFDDTPRQMSGPVWTVIAAILLSGCASVPTVPKTVLVPTPVPCLSAPPPEVPPLTDESALLAMDEFAATLVTWGERLSLRSYAAKADALLQSCAR